LFTPKFNLETDLPTIREFVRANPLCTLVTRATDGLVATHLPMVLHEDGPGLGTLRGHVARANSQWKDYVASEEVLGIFHGPEHYISASWYPTKAVDGKVVPTWNYVAVHVYGLMRTIEDTDWLLEHLRTLTDINEVVSRKPWSVDDAPPEYIASLSRAIVGIEIPISRFEGKWKVSQNRGESDAQGVIEGLQEIATPASLAMGELVRSRRPR
jgi:transcriptional regulator